jgi:hypothetical protein
LKRKNILLVVIILLFVILALSGGYTYWNSASADKTCSNCHEIRNSVSSFHTSAHREVSCFECHGTALENGFHSLKEKSNMVFTHFKDDVVNEDIYLSEEQVLDLSGRCTKCHQSEYKDWQAGGHSTTYSDIFLDSVHNAMEPPYADCFRCHGMFYEGTINDLVEPLSEKGTWHLKDLEKIDDPTIPCLACHQVHTQNNLLSHNVMDSLGYLGRNPFVSLYIRADKMHLRADKLVKPRMYHDGEELITSEDYSQRLCLNCHSPNSVHENGTSDDRTPSGVHEGLSCNACHLPHSNDVSNSCVNCHPAISNCNLDVREMNTSYLNPASTNNIHFVTCNNCHKEGDKF